MLACCWRRIGSSKTKERNADSALQYGDTGRHLSYAHVDACLLRRMFQACAGHSWRILQRLCVDGPGFCIPTSTSPHIPQHALWPIRLLRLFSIYAESAIHRLLQFQYINTHHCASDLIIRYGLDIIFTDSCIHHLCSTYVNTDGACAASRVLSPALRE